MLSVLPTIAPTVISALPDTINVTLQTVDSAPKSGLSDVVVVAIIAGLLGLLPTLFMMWRQGKEAQKNREHETENLIKSQEHQMHTLIKSQEHQGKLEMSKLLFEKKYEALVNLSAACERAHEECSALKNIRIAREWMQTKDELSSLLKHASLFVSEKTHNKGLSFILAYKNYNQWLSAFQNYLHDVETGSREHSARKKERLYRPISKSSTDLATEYYSLKAALHDELNNL